MAVQASVIAQSLVSLLSITAQMAELIQNIEAGEEVSDAEWADLQHRLDDANQMWDRA
jgi:hypothetical protein